MKMGYLHTEVIFPGNRGKNGTFMAGSLAVTTQPRGHRGPHMSPARGMRDEIILPWFPFMCVCVCIYFNFHMFCCLSVVVRGLHCYTGFSLAAAGGAALQVQCERSGAAALWSTGSVVVLHGLGAPRQGGSSRTRD